MMMMLLMMESGFPEVGHIDVVSTRFRPISMTGCGGVMAATADPPKDRPPTIQRHMTTALRFGRRWKSRGNERAGGSTAPEGTEGASAGAR